MANVTLLCFLLLAVGLVSVTSLPSDTINSTDDLRGKEFGSKYPRHGLYLLYWFCHDYISFDNNGMRPVSDPNNRTYGFHYYQNLENLLHSLRNLYGYAYYTVGNLLDNVNLPAHERLPDYVTQNFFIDNGICRIWNLSHENNRDRIIVRRNPSGKIDEVYITQHYELGTNRSNYDPSNTFRVDSAFIRYLGNMTLKNFLNDSQHEHHRASSHSTRSPNLGTSMKRRKFGTSFMSVFHWRKKWYRNGSESTVPKVPYLGRWKSAHNDL